MGKRFWAIAGLSVSLAIIGLTMVVSMPDGIYCYSIHTLYQNTCDLKRMKPS